MNGIFAGGIGIRCTTWMSYNISHKELQLPFCDRWDDVLSKIVYQETIVEDISCSWVWWNL